MTLKDAIKLARPQHWIKNVIVLFPVVFARRMSDPQAWLDAALAAVGFCLASGAIYVVNDIADYRRDRLHPAKKNRPLAAGRVSVAAAAGEAGVLLAAGVLVVLAGATQLLYVCLAYIVLNVLYSLVLKHAMILDVICIAMGFVLRAVAGAVAIRVEISPWLVVCTFTICLFMGFCKRSNEIATLGDLAQAKNHRRTLGGYTSDLLTHLITLSAAIAVVSFLMYSTSARTVGNIRTIYLVYTLPIVVYGVFRFAMLSMRGQFADPIDIFLHDKPIQLTAVFWMTAVLLIVRYGEAVKTWLANY